MTFLLSIGSIESKGKKLERGDEIQIQPAVLENCVRTLSERFVPRDCGHIENLTKVADYIQGQLKSSTTRVSRQSFNVKEWNQRNQLIDGRIGVDVVQPHPDAQLT